jgi:hypothetical protein
MLDGIRLQFWLAFAYDQAAPPYQSLRFWKSWQARL